MTMERTTIHDLLELALQQNKDGTEEEIISHILPLYFEKLKATFVSIISPNVTSTIFPNDKFSNKLLRLIEKAVSDISVIHETKIISLAVKGHDNIFAIPLSNYGWMVVERQHPFLEEKTISILNIANQLGKSLNHKKSEGKLKLLYSLINSAGEAIQITSEDGQLIFLNTLGAKKMGVSKKNVENHKIHKLDPKFKTIKNWQTHINKLKRIKTNKYEIEIPDAKSGSIFFSEVFEKYAEISGKGYILSTCRNITENKLNEIALREAEEKYRTLVQYSQSVIFVMNEAGYITYLSPSIQDIMGLNPDEYIGHNFREYVIEQDLEARTEWHDKIINSDVPVPALDYRVRNNDGTLRWIRAVAKKGTDPKTGAKYVIGNAVDVTGYKLTESELIKSTKLLEQTSKTARVGSFDLNLINKEMSWSTIAKEIHEVPSDYLPDMSTILNFYEEGESRDLINEVFTRAAQSGEPFDIQIKIITPKGNRRWARVIGTTEMKGKMCTRILGTIQDIDHEKRKSTELQNTKMQLESIFNEISDVVYAMKLPDYMLLFITPSVEKISGFKVEELMQENLWWERVIHPEDMWVPEKVLYDIESVGTYNLTHRILTKDNQVKWVSNRGKVIYDENQKPVRLDAIITDKTLQQLAEQNLQKEIRFQKILLDISTTYINIDLNDVESTINASLQDIGTFVNADRAYIFSYNFTDKTTSNTHEWCADGISKEIENLQDIPFDAMQDLVDKHIMGQAFIQDNVYLMDDEKSGKFKQLQLSQSIKSFIAIPLRNHNELIGFVGFDAVRNFHTYTEREVSLLNLYANMIINIRNRKNWEQHLTAQEEKYRNIIANMNLGLLEVDNRDTILFANQSFCELSGYSLQELIGCNIGNLPIFDEAYHLIQENQFKRVIGISDSYEVNITDKKGHTRCWFVSGAPNFNDKGQLVGTIGIFLDITTQKDLEQQLANARDEAERAAKAKEIFLTNMSHEIRTPLNVIIGMIRQLRTGRLNEEQHFYINHSYSAAKHLLTILNNVLDMAKIEANELELKYQDFSLKYLAYNVQNILYAQAQDKGIDFIVYVSPVLNQAFIGDDTRLRQILINLLGNSIKFTEKGNVSLRIEVLESNEKSQRVNISVEDTGIGMSDEFINRIFEKFSQENDGTNRKYEGTGLGMAISRDLLLMMGSELKVSSAKNVGTTISFILDLPIGNRAKIASYEEPFKKEDLQGAHILVVEDNKMNLFLASKALTTMGCTVAEANNGLEALQILEHESFDIILMDIQMPEMDGIDVTKHIREKMKLKVPIIALTANAFKHDTDYYLSIGMNDYIIKPYNQSEFFTKIAHYYNLQKVSAEEDNVIQAE